MRIKIQMSSEGVWYHHNRHANAILKLCPLLYNRSSQRGQVMQKMAVLSKDWPEDIGHRQPDAYIRNIGESAPRFPLPLNRGPMPATRTRSRFARVVNEFLLGFRGIDFRAHEEFGWRSYLQLRLFPQQPVLSAVVTGLIWSFWHFPILVRGYAFPDNPYSGLIVFTVDTVLLSIIFGWLRLKTGSIWSTSLAHAATNAVGGNMSLLLFGGGASLLYVLDLGILGWIPLGALSAWIVLTGQISPATEKTNIATAAVR